MKCIFSLLLLLFAGGLASAQNIVQIEYYFDTDAGIGGNKIVSVTAATDGSFTFNPDVSALTKGYHMLYTRVKDSNNGWSQTVRRSVEVQPAPVTTTALTGEYSIDTDAGIGNNKAFSITRNAQDAGNFNISVTGVAAGYHTVYIRFKDAYGVWGHTIRRSIQVIPANNKLVSGEYFVDKDPGIGLGTAISLSAQTTDIAQQFAAQASSLTEGYHKLYVRFKDAAGFWSHTSRQSIEVIKQPGVIKIIAAEFFFKTDPGIGKGTKLTVPATSSDTLALAIPANAKSADIDTLYIRVRDNRDSTRWSYRAMKRMVKAAQTITFAAAATKKFGVADFDPGAKISSNMPLTYTSSDTTVASIVAGKVHLKKTGTTILSASQAGNISFKVATTVKQTLTVAKGDQTIAFAALPVKTYGSADFAVSATATSGLPVTFTSADTTIASIVNGKIHIKAAGKCNIKASQAGNSNYNAAKDSIQVLTINKTGQQIGFPAIPSLAVGAYDYTPTAIATSNLPLTYTSSNTAVATIINGRIHAVAPGTAIITATQAGNNNYTAAVAQTQTVTIIKGNQTIGFSEFQPVAYGAADFAPKAYATSGLPLSFSSSNTAIATIINGQVHITGAGTVRIIASQAGNTSYNAARDTSMLLTVSKASQTITFSVLPALQVGAADITPSAGSSSGLAVTFASSNTAIATIVNGKIHAVAGGSCTITASQTGNGNYNAAAAVKQTLTITKGSQVITFAALSPVTFGSADYSAGATASSGLTVSYTSSNNAVATIVNGLIHVTGVGTTNITASQAGNTGYNAATSVIKSLTVTKANQQITFADITPQPPGTADFSAGATASSGLAVNYTSSNPAVATIVNGLIHITGVGTANITAAQAGNAYYNAAASVVKTFTVTKAGQQITFATIPATPYLSADFAPGASSSSGLSITYTSSNTAVATIVNGLIHINGLGSSVITASQGGDATYNAAASVSQKLTVVKAKQTITFAVLAAKAYNAPDFDAAATASSGLPISYTSSNTAVATIVNGLIHITGSGTTVIQATQAGNTLYAAAPAINRTLTVNAKPAGTSVSTLAISSENNDSTAETRLAVKQAVSPNGDGINDVLVIDGITAYAENTVTLIDPNGLKIYERAGYDNQQVVFDGHSSVTGTMQKPGTYYYLITYKTTTGWKNLNGYFVLKY
ncbi:gliding motility-associated C-terminal domain-containing protein [Mucilaginibacter celer]|uniref:Gliding motility-associated C-terminal domain-containing protein n=1 Tax=Mucilaginibacter celer TaxID=2305508 RepID=A0A494VXP4_9SPHI|nr:gliding motility-associated C-terminal domain-containing protein [Mucilaginibacter celer]AYL96253.1 gliding motility-associated C-terminal domain-containing protein [Mucilaginibacter celer]